MNINPSINYQPPRTFDVEPERFGNQQADYLNRSRKIIDDTSKKIKHALQNHKNLKALFFEVLDDLSIERASIAKSHQTEDYQEFGTRRDRFSPGCVSVLAMNGPYQPYGDRLVKLFCNSLEKLPRLDGSLNIQELNKWGNIETKLTIRVMDLIKDQGLFEELSFAARIPTSVHHKMDYLYADFFSKKDSPSFQQELASCHQLFKNLKANNPQRYIDRKIFTAIQHMVGLYPTSEHCAVVHANLKLSIGGVEYSLTDYITWIYDERTWVHPDGLEQPLKYMPDYSVINLLHQDEYDIQATLEKGAEIFEKVMQWDKQTQSLEDLKNGMTILLYLLAHNMRELRGSAAETEWLEQSIYYALSIECSVDPGISLDLEAFANPIFSNFRDIYSKRVTLAIR